MRKKEENFDFSGGIIICLFRYDRYKAVMSPLSERSSKAWAKATIAALWLAGAALAAPSVLFFKFTHVFDDLNGGMKPFCAVAPSLVPMDLGRGNGSSGSNGVDGGNDTNAPDYTYYYDDATTLALVDSEGSGQQPAMPAMGLLQKMTTFQAYNCLLALFQVS